MSVCLAGDRHPIIEIDILIAVTRHHDGVALGRVELSLEFGAELKNQALLLDTAEAARAPSTPP